MKHRKNDDFIDDGRTIANMNVEGMPWYDKSRDNRDNEPEVPVIGKKEPLSVGETAAVTFGVLKAALLVAAIFAVVFAAFIILLYFVF